MRLFIVCCLLVLAALPAYANCYSVEEAEAEQAIKIHSELMVIGLNCQHMTPRGQQNFYAQYRNFTNRHADLYSNYEKTLINYYQRNGGNAERRVHDLRTGFANQISTDAASMRPDIFCSNFVRRLGQVNAMSRQELRQWASMAASRQPLTRPICAN